MARRNIKISVPTVVSGVDMAGAFSVSVSGLAEGSRRLRRGGYDDHDVYITPHGQGSFYTPLGDNSRTIYIEAEDDDGFGIRKQVTLLGSTALSTRKTAINKTYGGRAITTPTAFYDYVGDEQLDPDTHTVSDPVSGTCSVFTHKAIRDGNWSDPTMWDTGTTPHALTDGTATVCSGPYTITYDVVSDVRIKDIHINHAGKLIFSTARTRLWVDTIMCDGKLVIGDMSSPIPDSGIVEGGKRVPQCEIIFWASEAPGITTRLGLNTMGPVRIFGEQKAYRVDHYSDLLAGTTEVTIPNLAAKNWKVGDQLLFVATEYQGTTSSDPTYIGPTQFYGPWQGSDGTRTRSANYMKSGDDVRTITAIDGNTITLSSALTFDHKVYSGELKRGQTVTVPVFIANMTRSICFRSAGSGDTAIWSGADITDLQKRAHIMFMHSDDVEVRWYETQDMARTDTDPSLVRAGQGETRATAGGTIITNPNNVRGRYATHFHGNGAYISRKMCVAEGVVNKGQIGPDMTAVPQPGWAMVHHNGRVAIEKCITYNTRGAGYVSENGNELGQWIDNISAWNRGDGYPAEDWGNRHELFQNHHGHSGVGYENQARQVLCQGNITSSSHTCWFYFQQSVGQQVRVPDQYSLRVYDPIAMSGGLNEQAPDWLLGTYGIEQAQIPDFNDNICLASKTGFTVAHRQFTDRSDNTPMIAKRFHCINVDRAYHLINYTFHYYFYDSLWIGRPGNDGEGARLGNVSWVQTFANIHMVNFPVGIRNAGTGLNAGGFYIDLTFEDVTTPGNDAEGFWDTGTYPPENCPLNGCMGPWSIVNGSTMIIRPFEVIDSETDIPIALPAAGMGPGTEPAPGTPKPYFTLNPASVTNAAGAFVLRGTITDKLGSRWWPFAYSSESFAPTYAWNTYNRQPGTGSNATRLVQRNGCFYDGSTLKTRLWFVDIERLTGEYFTFYIDMTVGSLASDVITANLVNPWQTMPVVPLQAESIAPTVMSDDMHEHMFMATLTMATPSVEENVEPGTVISTFGNVKPGSVLALTNDAGGRFAIDGSNRLVAGLTNINYEEATSYTIEVQELNMMAPNSGRRTSFIVAVQDVAEPPFPQVAPAITPTFGYVGGTLTAVDGTWSPTPISYAYQWYRDGVAISGATSKTYTAVSADQGKVLTVGIIATGDAGASPEAVSFGTSAIAAEGEWWAPNAKVDVDYVNDRAYINGTEYASIAAARSANAITDDGGADRVGLSGVGGSNPYSIAVQATAPTTTPATATASSSELLSADSNFLCAVSSSTSNYAGFWYARVGTQAVMRFGVQVGGNTIFQAQLDTPTVDALTAPGRARTYCARIVGNNFAYALDGSVRLTDTSGSSPVPTGVTIGARYGGTLPWGGTVGRIVIVPSAVANDKLPYLLPPPDAPSYSEATNTVLARMGTLPDAPRVEAIGDVVDTLTAAGILAKMNFFYVLAAHDERSSRCNWARNSSYLSPVNSPTFVADEGWYGNGTNAYLSTGIQTTATSVPNLNVQAGSSNLGVWCLDDPAPTTTTWDIGSNGTQNWGLSARDNSTGGIRGAWSSSFTSSDAVSDAIGYSLMTNTDLDERRFYRDGTLVSAGSFTSASLSGFGNIHLMRRDTNYSTRKIAVAHLGTGLTPEEAVILSDALEGYMTAIDAI